MINRLRRQLEPHLLKVGKLAARSGIPPIAWTYIGTLVAIFSGLAYSGSLGFNGRTGGVLLLASGLLDVIDGSAARVLGRVSDRGAFLDSTLDRLGEIFVFAGILVGGLAHPLLVIVALSLSIMVSYVRARAEGLGVQTAGVGFGERAERIILLALLSILGYTSLGVFIVLVLAGFTTAHRIFHVASTLRGRSVS